MFNWSTNTTELKKNSQAYKQWHLEQLINFGLGNEKLHKTDLQRFLPKLNIDSPKKKYLTFLLSQ